MSSLETYRLWGPDRLDPTGLVALVVGPAPARALVETFGGLSHLATLPVDALAAVPGVGARQAVRLHAAFALAPRAAQERATGLSVTTPVAAAEVFVPLLGHLAVEEVHALFLDRRSRIRRVRRCFAGSAEAAIVDARVIARTALELGAHAVVLGHNHPSGDPEPSVEDIRSTRQVAATLDVVGIQLVDHLIVGGGRWTSLRQEGRL